ncbi:PREDICTED: uncharacterized protein LOC106819006 [Priapulus caudatus]|uniref:Uncharacterized protein LOC106819006 n=1 Tax=Priapulus caudatus TaxID=37621 RepID=A0ABM1F3Y2_PRICU|nr:PREDICTED: uncharacterized protein LOC106819006 [Priapulus caudatus]
MARRVDKYRKHRTREDKIGSEVPKRAHGAASPVAEDEGIPGPCVWPVRAGGGASSGWQLATTELAIDLAVQAPAWPICRRGRQRRALPCRPAGSASAETRRKVARACDRCQREPATIYMIDIRTQPRSTSYRCSKCYGKEDFPCTVVAPAGQQKTAEVSAAPPGDMSWVVMDPISCKLCRRTYYSGDAGYADHRRHLCTRPSYACHLCPDAAAFSGGRDLQLHYDLCHAALAIKVLSHTGTLSSTATSERGGSRDVAAEPSPSDQQGAPGEAVDDDADRRVVCDVCHLVSTREFAGDDGAPFRCDDCIAEQGDAVSSEHSQGGAGDAPGGAGANECSQVIGVVYNKRWGQRAPPLRVKRRSVSVDEAAGESDGRAKAWEKPPRGTAPPPPSGRGRDDDDVPRPTTRRPGGATAHACRACSVALSLNNQGGSLGCTIRQLVGVERRRRRGDLWRPFRARHAMLRTPFADC